VLWSVPLVFHLLRVLTNLSQIIHQKGGIKMTGARSSGPLMFCDVSSCLWILNMALASFHRNDAWNFEGTARFLENLYTALLKVH
jgi:hypothetical protein